MRRMFSEKQVKEMAQAETTSLVESGELENAKPIYYHPINCYNDALGVLSFLILDNQEAAYTSDNPVYQQGPPFLSV